MTKFTDEEMFGKGGKPSGLTWGSTSTGKSSFHKSCHESHPPLPIGDKVVYGGSCTHPKVSDCDLYVGFDSSMRMTARSLPWVHGEEMLFEIQDMGVPRSAESFDKLVRYVADALAAGKKVHCGCIGGHGRTGTFFAALVKHMTGDADAISYVRKNYCKKAVESREQAEWLYKHCGIKIEKGYKEHGISRHPREDWPAPTPFAPSAPVKQKPARKAQKDPFSMGGSSGRTSGLIEPMGNKDSIWG